MDRRTLAVGALAALIALSGCLGFLSGPLTFQAQKVTVENGTLQNADYEEVAVTKLEVNRTFSVGGQSKEVVVTNWLAQYEKQVSVLGMERRAAVFSAFSSPEVSVLGKTFNPIDDYTNRELIQLVQQQYGSISNIQHVSNATMQMLGEQTSVAKFSANAQLSGGQSVDVYVHVTSVNHEGDVVVAVGVYPQELGGEQQAIFTLIQNLTHHTE